MRLTEDRSCKVRGRVTGCRVRVGSGIQSDSSVRALLMPGEMTNKSEIREAGQQLDQMVHIMHR